MCEAEEQKRRVARGARAISIGSSGLSKRVVLVWWWESVIYVACMFTICAEPQIVYLLFLSEKIKKGLMAFCRHKDCRQRRRSVLTGNVHSNNREKSTNKLFSS